MVVVAWVAGLVEVGGLVVVLETRLEDAGDELSALEMGEEREEG